MLLFKKGADDGSLTTITKANSHIPIKGDDGTWGYKGSTDAEDSMGDVMDVETWRLDRYQANPVILWAHQNKLPPIGKAVAVHKNLSGSPKSLDFRVRFATSKEYGGDWPKDLLPSPPCIESMVGHGFIRGSSVGFNPGSDAARDIERVFNAATGRPQRRFKNQELLELSIVPIPCNAGALTECMSHGWMTKDMLPIVVGSIKAACGDVPADKVDAELLECATKELAAPKIFTVPEGLVLVHLDDLRVLLREATEQGTKSTAGTNADATARVRTPAATVPSRANVMTAILRDLDRKLSRATNEKE